MKKFGFLAMFLGLSMLVVGCCEDKKAPVKTGDKDKPAAGVTGKDVPHEPAEGTTGAAKPADAPKP